MEVRVRHIDVPRAVAGGRGVEIDFHPVLVGERAHEAGGARRREADRTSVYDRRSRIGEVRRVRGRVGCAHSARRPGREVVPRHVDEVVDGAIGLVEVAVERDAGHEQVAVGSEPHGRVTRRIEPLEGRGVAGSRRVRREARNERVEPRRPAVVRHVEADPDIERYRHHPVVVGAYRHDVRVGGTDGGRRLVRLPVLGVEAGIRRAAVDIVVVVRHLDVHAVDRVTGDAARHCEQARRLAPQARRGAGLSRSRTLSPSSRALSSSTRRLAYPVRRT